MLASRNVRLAREAGALATLPAALQLPVDHVGADGRAGHGRRAGRRVDGDHPGHRGVPLRHAQIILAPGAGTRRRPPPSARHTAQDPADPDEGTDVSLARYAMSRPAQRPGQLRGRAGSGRAAPATPMSCRSAVRACPSSSRRRPGRRPSAGGGRGSNELSSRAHASGTAWALGLAARSRALTSTGPVAEGHYREAIEQLRNCRMTVYLARTHLVYGEWLRREGRRQDARDAAPHGPPDVVDHGRGGLRRARCPGAAGHR